MCVRPHDGNVKQLAGQHIGGADTAADYGRSCTVQASIWSLGAAQSEFHDTIALSRENDAGGFRCNQALMVDNV